MKSFVSGIVLALLFSPLAAQAQSDNLVYINQIGDGSTVTITQTGERNRIGDSPTVPAVLGGSNGTSTITQTGNDNIVSAYVTVTDGGNRLTLNQQGNRNLYEYGRTDGAGHVITLTQNGTSNAIGTSVFGRNNVVTILQEGRVNNARLSAYGTGNRLVASSQGNGNTIRLKSEGSNNVMNMSQVGSGHTIIVNQAGNNANLAITQR